MTRTGWIGEDPDGQGPAMPATEFILANRADPGQGRTLGQVLARAEQAPDRGGPEAEDSDDRAARLVTHGYSPGLLRSLTEQLGDVCAELESERGKLEAGTRRAEYLHRAHEAGRLTAWQVMERLDVDGGDESRVALLERKRDALRAQLAEATDMITPAAQRTPDPVEAAVARAQDAHRQYVEVTRARMAELEARRPAPRPFGSVSRGAAGTEHTPDCRVCAWHRRMEAEDQAPYAAGSVIATEWEDERTMRGADAGAGMAVRTVPDAIVGVL